MKNIGLIFRPSIPHIQHIFEELGNFTDSFSFSYLYPESMDSPDYVIKHDTRLPLDLILVFGGDGTILRALSYALKYSAPVLGFNMGTLGFLTDCKMNEIRKAMKDIKSNTFNLESRMLLDVSVYRNNQKIGHFIGLNDAVIFKGEMSNLISLNLYENNRFVYETRCDGIIISSPTGSTAYSLSAGGPIISPFMDAIIITPLNPHILSIRPMVFSARESIQLILKKDHLSSVLQIDGDNVLQLMPDDKVVVKAASGRLHFIKLQHRTFFRILRKKLHMAKK